MELEDKDEEVDSSSDDDTDRVCCLGFLSLLSDNPHLPYYLTIGVMRSGLAIYDAFARLEAVGESPERGGHSGNRGTVGDEVADTGSRVQRRVQRRHRVQLHVAWESREAMALHSCRHHRLLCGA